MNEADQLLDDFLVESFESLDQIDLEMMDLEVESDSPDLLDSIFRGIHTIKGTASFFDLFQLSNLAHSAENLLSLMRSGHIKADSQIIDALLASLDAMRLMLDTVSQTGTDTSFDQTGLINRLARLAHSASDSADRHDGIEPYDELSANHHPVAEPPLDSHESVESSLFLFEDDDVDDPASAAGMDDAHSGDDGRLDDGAEPKKAGRKSGQDVSDGRVRVDVGLLDRLMNLVGELVLARNQLLQGQKDSDQHISQIASQQLNLITAELQEGVMKTRMQPISRVWAKVPRSVRDLAIACDKKVRVEIAGGNTELDRTILEAIKDPLTHLVRNAIDHGIERPEQRVEQGKPETGLLEVRAFDDGGHVIIEISDDGAGLDLRQIREAAVACGVGVPEAIATMADEEVANLIFAPGLSTANTVSNVSGRGVGMDVVRANIESVGGGINITTTRGVGTTFTIRIPLTLAIIPTLIVRCGDEPYLISQVSLVEVLHVGRGTDSEIESAGGIPLLRLRDTLLPVVQLREVLGLEPAELNTGANVDIAVLQIDRVTFGLVVDQIVDTEEIVVKPLSPHLNNLGVFSGTTILGDGRVALILDAAGVARGSGLFRHKQREQRVPTARPTRRGGDAETVLGCMVGSTLIGVPLVLISRIERLPATVIEHTMGEHVALYRDGVMRLCYLSDMVGSSGRPEPEVDLTVLVYEQDGEVYGLVVDEVVDSLEIDPANGLSVGDQTLRVAATIGRRESDRIKIDELVASTRSVVSR